MKKNNLVHPIVSRYKNIVSQLARFTKNGQQPKIVVVTKNRPNELIVEFLTSVESPILGENRVDEALTKIEHLKNYSPSWHFIGHLQRNKVKKVIGRFSLIQSVSSIQLAREINKRAKNQEMIVNCLAQIDICEDGTKFGFSPSLPDLSILLEKMKDFENLRIKGLMTIAPYLPAEETRPYFKRMFSLFSSLYTLSTNYQNISMEILSMGMSNDYIIALEEGSTMIRLGSAIFE